MTPQLPRYLDYLPQIEPLRFSGEVVELRGLPIESTGPTAAVGDFCELISSSGRTSLTDRLENR